MTSRALASRLHRPVDISPGALKPLGPELGREQADDGK